LGEPPVVTITTLRAVGYRLENPTDPAFRG
jgi:hypothetical protein